MIGSLLGTLVNGARERRVHQWRDLAARSRTGAGGQSGTVLVTMLRNEPRRSRSSRAVVAFNHQNDLRDRGAMTLEAGGTDPNEKLQSLPRAATQRSRCGRIQLRGVSSTSCRSLTNSRSRRSSQFSRLDRLRQAGCGDRWDHGCAAALICCGAARGVSCASLNTSESQRETYFSWAARMRTCTRSRTPHFAMMRVKFALIVASDRYNS